MKILTITENFLVGGLETRILSVNCELRKLGHQVEIYAENIGQNTNIRKILNTDINKLSLLERINVFNDIINKEKPDFLDLHPFYTIEQAGIVALSKGIPFSVTLHGKISLDYVLANKLAYSIVENASFICCVSEPLLLKAKGVFKNTKCILSRNGVLINKEDIKEKKNVNNESLLIVSRLDDYKSTAIEHFFDLFSKTTLAKRIIKNIDIIGDGPAKEKLCERAKRLKINAKFLGSKKATDYMDGYRFVGGVGRVVIEAAAKQRAVFLLDYNGVAGLLNKDNYKKYADNNFANIGEYITANEFDSQLLTFELDSSLYMVANLVEKINNIEVISEEFERCANEAVQSYKNTTVDVLLKIISSYYDSPEKEKISELQSAINVFDQKIEKYDRAFFEKENELLQLRKEKSKMNSQLMFYKNFVENEIAIEVKKNNEIKQEIQRLNSILTEIQSAKFYRIWQKLNKLKKMFI